MTKEEFTSLKEDLVNKFLTEYEGERVESGNVAENGAVEELE